MLTDRDKIHQYVERVLHDADARVGILARTNDATAVERGKEILLQAANVHERYYGKCYGWDKP